MADRQATYRLQLHAGFGFAEAAAVAPYLARLGVTHAYFSPYLQAAPGSTHGYDVVDHSRVNDELGGPAEHARLIAALRAEGLEQVVDVVPNHMAITGPGNAWWWDVLEYGPASRFALYFDIAWDPPDARLREVILLPVLGDHYGRELEGGRLRLERSGAAFRIRYFEHRFPVAPESMGALLAEVAGQQSLPQVGELAAALKALEPIHERNREAAERRHAEHQAIRRRLARLLQRDERARQALDEALDALNRDPDRLDEILDHQHYRLARWQAAGFDLDYRRFFDINSLAAIRVGDERVFSDTHRFILGWLRDGTLDGIRIDHPDGLGDPLAYFARVRAEGEHVWMVAEKILQPGESLPEDWPIAGTTGYEFLARAGGLLLDPAGEQQLTSLYESFTGDSRPYADVAYESKHLVMRELLGSDIRRLVALLERICERRRRYRDFTSRELDQAVREVIAGFAVYRTYCRPGTPVSGQDEEQVEAAISRARSRRPGLDPELFAFLRDLLLLRHPGSIEQEFVVRFQQTSAPVMAKAVEDTAFYRYLRLVALNEVGGDPSIFGTAPKDFHAANQHVQRRWPATMVASSTHDTKRSEDVRARLYLLSEIPDRWAAAVNAWRLVLAPHRTGEWPDPNTELLMYQTLLGAYPLPADRLARYLEKATREAKVHTSWIAPNDAYDQAIRRFAEGACDDQSFLASLRDFVEPLLEPGWINALSLKLLTLTAPGIPDIYQGSELWDLSLVDPDNRRPVDFAARGRLLESLDGMSPEEIWRRVDEGLPKLLVVRRALELRRRHPECFGAGGTYRPIWASGSRAAHAVAFSRGERVVTLATRLILGLKGDWGDTVLPLGAGRWRNQLTGDCVAGGRLPVAELLSRFPVALLYRVEA